MNISKNDVIEFIKRVITSVILIFCVSGAYLHSALLFSFLILSIMCIILVFEWPKLLNPNVWYFWPATFLYPVLPCLSLIHLVFRYHGNDFYVPLYPLFIAWTADTCGYLFGKLWGKHKMCPSISPGKSWEGFIGGIGGIIVVHAIFVNISPTIRYLMPKPLFLSIPIVSFFMATIAFLGGFFLSYLKRKHGLKDAGNLLPGHGGLLDRFDGVFFVTLVTTLAIILGTR